MNISSYIQIFITIEVDMLWITIIMHLSPNPILWDMFTVTVPSYNSKQENLSQFSFQKLIFGTTHALQYGTVIWDNLPCHLRDFDSKTFKKYLEEW